MRQHSRHINPAHAAHGSVRRIVLRLFRQDKTDTNVYITFFNQPFDVSRKELNFVIENFDECHIIFD